MSLQDLCCCESMKSKSAQLGNNNKAVMNRIQNTVHKCAILILFTMI